jgi:hypothetical protein
LLWLAHVLSCPVRIEPPERSFTDVVSTVSRAVLLGASTKAVFVEAITRYVYVPFAEIDACPTPPNVGVSVPTVRLDTTNETMYSSFGWNTFDCESVAVPFEVFDTELDEYAQPEPRVQPVALPVKFGLVRSSVPNEPYTLSRFDGEFQYKF